MAAAALSKQIPPPSSSWTLSIRSATDSGRHRHALSLYALLHRSGHRPSPFAISSALKSCSKLLPIPTPFSLSLHSHLLKLGHHSHPYASTSLLHLHSLLPGHPSSARQLFDEMPNPTSASYNSLLSSYLRSGRLRSARQLFDRMPVKDVVSWNSMLSGYAKSGDMSSAHALFRRIPDPNPASWNGMISGYIDSDDIAAAKKLFDEMPVRSNVSWITMISGCTRSGDVALARKLFDEMETRDVFSWNAMIACYAQNGCTRDAVHLFNRMRKPDTGVCPDEMTFSSVVSACSQLGDLRFGLWVEEYMGCVGIQPDDHLRTALIDLYLKCGGTDKAFELFDGLKERDVVAYSAMIVGCAINGRSTDAIRLFKEMLGEKILPNEVTFMGLLTAYNHAGLVEEGYRSFSSMWPRHRVPPTADHYAIVVDMFGRSGRLEEAYQLIRKMPMKPHAGVWGALLLACRLHGNVELGEIAGEKCFELKPADSGYYVLLSNIYAEAGKWEKVKKLRKLMAERGLTKTQGCSWVQAECSAVSERR